MTPGHILYTLAFLCLIVLAGVIITAELSGEPDEPRSGKGE